MISIFMIFATEICMGHPQYKACVEWMMQCQTWQQTRCQEWTPELGAKDCSTRLPDHLKVGVKQQ